MEKYLKARKRFRNIQLPSLQEGFLWDRLDDAAKKLERVESLLLEAKSDFVGVVDVLLGEESQPFSDAKQARLLFFAASVLDAYENIHPEAEGKDLVFKIRKFLAKVDRV